MEESAMFRRISRHVGHLRLSRGVIIKAQGGKGCDLIFMASHGRRGLSAVLLGSEAKKVLAHSTVPVLACR
jgi:nucleotide-binding universal stress UspA family protein